MSYLPVQCPSYLDLYIYIIIDYCFISRIYFHFNVWLILLTICFLDVETSYWVFQFNVCPACFDGESLLPHWCILYNLYFLLYLLQSLIFLSHTYIPRLRIINACYMTTFSCTKMVIINEILYLEWYTIIHIFIFFNSTQRTVLSYPFYKNVTHTV